MDGADATQIDERQIIANLDREEFLHNAAAE
jgi:hypothetical protein